MTQTNLWQVLWDSQMFVISVWWDVLCVPVLKKNKVSVSKRWAWAGRIKIAQSRTVTGFQDDRFSFCRKALPLQRGCHVGTLFLSGRECTLPRRGTLWKCLQGSLTIHGSTSLLMGPTTILIIDVVIDSAVLPPLTGAAEFTCMTLFVVPILWPFPSHLPSVSEISVILHLSFVICCASRAVFSPLRLPPPAGRWCWRTAVGWAYADDVKMSMWSVGRCWREAALIGDKWKLIGGKNASGNPRGGYLTPAQIKHSLGR